jgi:hypothetical protein
MSRVLGVAGPFFEEFMFAVVEAAGQFYAAQGYVVADGGGQYLGDDGGEWVAENVKVPPSSSCWCAINWD